MTAFLGIARFDGEPLDPQIEERTTRLLSARRGGRVQAHGVRNVLFAQRVEAIPGSRAGETANQESQVLFAADARLDNRQELAAALAIPSPDVAGTSDASLILRMYKRWGEAGIARCLGAFAFALWDANARRLILGRDCLGNKALFFHCRHGLVAFATMLGDLLALPHVPREIDEEMLADFLAVNVTEPRRTLYKDVERVPSRTIVAIDRQGISHSYYWSPNVDAPAPYRREEDYIERTRELFDQAVASAIADTPHVAISTSGGLDSSAIAATVARLGMAGRITCYTVVPPADAQIDVGPSRYSDERGKIEALARLYPGLDVRYFAPEALHANEVDLTRLFLGLSLPSIGTAVLGPYSFLYDAVAAAGHRVLLVGNKGNFGVSWRGSHSLRVLLRTGQWATFLRELSALARQGPGIVQTLKSDLIIPALPESIRHGLYRALKRDPYDVTRFSALNPAYIVENGLPKKWRAQGFDPWFIRSDPNPARFRANILFDYNQMARDMTGMNREWSGFDYHDPHSDRRLLEFVLKVPEPLFRRNGVPRSFARTVFADRLPREILAERRRGAQTVTWFRNLDKRRNDLAAAVDGLETSTVARRLIDLPRLKQLMREWPADEHAAERRMEEYRLMLMRAAHAGQFIRWVEGRNA
jgi:asparagine synthase (glutamine-hydrolysing)